MSNRLYERNLRTQRAASGTQRDASYGREYVPMAEEDVKEFDGERIDLVGEYGDAVVGTGNPDEHRLSIQIMVDTSGSVASVLRSYTNMVNTIIESIKHIPFSPYVSFGTWDTMAVWWYINVTADEMPKVRFNAPGGTEPLSAIVAHRLLQVGDIKKLSKAGTVLDESELFETKPNAWTSRAEADSRNAQVQSRIQAISGASKLTTLEILITDGDWGVFMLQPSAQAMLHAALKDNKVTRLWATPTTGRGKLGTSTSSGEWLKAIDVHGRYLLNLRRLEDVGVDISRIIAYWAKEASREKLAGIDKPVDLDKYIKTLGVW